jgi:acylpyruvate hydrolase
MRLLSYTTGAGPGWGIRVAGGVIPGAALGKEVPASLQALIEQAALWPARARDWPARAAAATPVALAGLTLLPCVPQPGKIICLGFNYSERAEEVGHTGTDFPPVFLRSSLSLLAHGAALRMPALAKQMDFEAELAVVIGKQVRFAGPDAALAAVFGYSCFNDATLRDFQRLNTLSTIGKNFEATGGFGPYLVTADEVPPGGKGLRIQSRLNGEIMQDANTRHMIFGVAQTISLLSQCMTLEPGDVLMMGTPDGVGFTRKPPLWMRPGDTIEVEIEGVGVLSNTVSD